MAGALWVVLFALLVVLHRQVHGLRRDVERGFRSARWRGKHMSKELDDLVVQVAETNGVMESATVAFGGVVEKLDVLAAKLEEAGIDNALVVAASTDLKGKTEALAAAIAAVPAG